MKTWIITFQLFSRNCMKLAYDFSAVFLKIPILPCFKRVLSGKYPMYQPYLRCSSLFVLVGGLKQGNIHPINMNIWDEDQLYL